MTVVIGFLFLKDTRGTDLLADEKHVYGRAGAD